MLTKGLKIVSVNVLVLVGLLAVVELILQAVALVRPSYEVLFLQPDRVLGWKQVPGSHWKWAGHFWYANDFSVDVHTNSLGFRDLEREPVKPKGTRRVAMLGDSYIEAIQVPLELTAAQLLERKLNAADADSRWEVMNFGISNYGIGQYLLAWEQYASNFGPDYVAIFVAKLHMRRTVDRYEIGAFSATQSAKLWVRPTFALEGDRLIREPAQDFERFEAAQQTLVENTFNGDRSKRRTMLITGYYLRDTLQRFNAARTPKAPERKSGSSMADAERLAISLKIIEELGRNVERAGGKRTWAGTWRLPPHWSS